MGNVTHRLGQILEYKKMTIYAFEKYCGLSKNRLYNAINEGTDMGLSNLEMISNKCPELNMDWLITGRGEMLMGENGTAPVAVATGAVAEGALLAENVELLRENRQLRIMIEGLRGGKN